MLAWLHVALHGRQHGTATLQLKASRWIVERLSDDGAEEIGLAEANGAIER